MTLELELFAWDAEALAYATGVKKTFAEWGIEDQEINGVFREQIADELKLIFPGRALLAIQFPYRSRVKITVDAVPLFSGYVTDPDPRQGDGNTNRSSATIAGAWWYLENLVFQQARNRLTAVVADEPVFATDYYTQFTLNLPITANYQNITFASVYYTVTLLDSRAQIIAALDYAIAKGAWIAYDAADIIQIPVRPAEVMNITCAEAIRRQLEDVDAIAWFDHTQDPPKFHCARRQDLAAYARGLGNAKQAQGFNLKRRYDLAVSYVLINFQQSYSVGAIQGINQVQDIYPDPKPADEFKALITTVPLRAVSGTVHTKYIRTEAIDPTDLDWWKRRKPELDAAVNPKAATDYADLALVTSTENRAVIEGTAGLGNMIVDGGYVDFMGGSIGDEQITIQAKYHRRYDTNRAGTKVSSHTFRAHCKTTSLNFPAGVNYTFTEYSSLGESITSYLGLAQIIYEDLNAPQWEGSIPLFEKTYSGATVLGKNLNLTGGLTEWETMDALVHEITFKIKPGGIFYNVTVGPNKKLSAQQLTDRLRAARTRYITPISFGPGGLQTSIKLTRHQASHDLSSAEPAASDYAVNDPNGDDSAVGNVTLSGNLGQPVISSQVNKTDGTVDTTKPRLRLDAADITNGRAL